MRLERIAILKIHQSDLLYVVVISKIEVAVYANDKRSCVI